jgi:hypothetical protein
MPQHQLFLDPDPTTLPEDVAFRQLVDIAKLRWRIERDYQELKQEVGLGYFEGQGWRGFHHHATLCIAAYGFLISDRQTIPPSTNPPTTSRESRRAVCAEKWPEAQAERVAGLYVFSPQEGAETTPRGRVFFRASYREFALAHLRPIPIFKAMIGIR